MSKAYSYIHHWKTNKMVAIEKTGTSSEIKEQHKKHEKFVGHFFFFPKKKTCAKRKMEVKGKENKG